MINEEGSDSFTVVLATQPSEDVTVTVASDDPDAVSVTSTPPLVLTFTTGNWDTAQTVTVSGVGDTDGADETVDVILDPDSGDTNYRSLDNVTVTVNVTDIDEPGLDVMVPNNWGLIPSELSGGDKFRLLFLSSTTTTATSADIADYNTFIQALADAGHSDIQGYSAGFRVVGCTADVDAHDNTGTNTSTGVPIYWLNGTKVADDNSDFYNRNWDDEENNKNESGTNGPDTEPRNRPYTGCDHDGTEAVGSDNMSNALGEDSVRLGTPNESGAGNGPISSQTTATNPRLQRPMYGLSQVFEVPPPPPGLDLSDTSVDVDEEGSGSFTVALATRPTADVTVDVTSKNIAAATVLPAVLEFTTGNWSTAQTVTVSGVQDGDSNDETVIVELDPGSGDSDYGDLDNVTVTVTVNDAEPPPPEVTVSDDWGLIPSGLSGGDKFRLLFVSSSSMRTAATSADIAVYNSFIQALADAGHSDIQGYSAGFRVVGCTADVDARDNTGTNTGTGVPIYWLNGTKVADDNSDFYNRNWDDEENNKNESGTNGPSTINRNRPYTGCDHDGTEAVGSDNMSNALGEDSVRLGAPNESGAGNGPISSQITATSPSIARHMYGLSQVFEVASAAGLDLSDTSVDVDEEGSGSFTVALATRPTADVTVDVTSKNIAAATVLPAVLEFTTGNWSTAQTVTVSGVQDGNSNDETVIVELDPGSGDSDYGDLDNVTVTVTVNDDDAEPPPPEVTVSDDWGLIPSGLSGGDKFRLLFLSSTTTTATSADIAVYNSFIQELVDVGHSDIQGYSAGFRVVGCTADVDARDNTGTNTGTGVPIYWLNGSQVADDNSDFYRHTWDDEINTKNESGTNDPRADVYVWTGCDHDGTADVSGTYSFALGSVAEVSVGRPNIGRRRDGPIGSSFQVHPSFPNPMYGLSQVFEVARRPGLNLSGTSVDVVEEGSGSFTVALASQPSGAVNVAVTSGNTDAVSVTSTSLLEFNTSNWDTAHTVTVSGVGDANARDVTATITLDPESVDDADYRNLANATVTVNVTDNDVAGLVIDPLSVTFADNETGTFTVALDTQPIAAVNVAVTSNNTDVATVTPTSPLEFTTDNWNTAQTVTVSGVDDANAVDDTINVTLEVMSSDDTDYKDLPRKSVEVTVTDNGSARVSVSNTSLDLSEGGDATYEMELDAQPTTDVEVRNCSPTIAQNAMFETETTVFNPWMQSGCTPSAPRNMTVEQVNQTREFNITWDAPASLGAARPEMYEIQWKHSDQVFNFARFNTVEADATNTTIGIGGKTNDLTIRIRARSATVDVGDWDSSSQVTCTHDGSTWTCPDEVDSTKNSFRRWAYPTRLSTVCTVPLLYPGSEVHVDYRRKGFELGGVRSQPFVEEVGCALGFDRGNHRLTNLRSV